jgi:hypothetical protein
MDNIGYRYAASSSVARDRPKKRKRAIHGGLASVNKVLAANAGQMSVIRDQRILPVWPNE